MRSGSGLLTALALLTGAARAAEALPRSWIDPATGHRVVQLSTEPNSNSLYFTQYAYTNHGTRLIMTTRHGVDLVTVSTGVIEHVLEGNSGRVFQAGRKTGKIFLTKDGYVCSLDPDTKVLTQLAKLPEGGSVVTVNSDETLAAGSISDAAPQRSGGRRAQPPAEQNPPPPPGGYRTGFPQPGHDDYPGKLDMMIRGQARHSASTIFTINLQTG